ncbi:unnamed protein product [Lathyrus sativus]|nr:unnamed protein product [Lathyrus sativus]
MMPGDTKDYYSSNLVDRYEIHDNTIIEVLSPKSLNFLRLCLDNLKITERSGTERNINSIPLFGYFTTEQN